MTTGAATEPRQQFDWDPGIRETVLEHCLAGDHPAGPPLIRVTDFYAMNPPQRLRFTSRQCDCGQRLYIDGDVSIREVKPITINHRSTTERGLTNGT